jgi:hypothetical protein
VRTAIQRNDAGVVNHFSHNDDVFGRLHNLNVRAIRLWEHRRGSLIRRDQATFGCVEIFRPIGRMVFRTRLRRLEATLRIGQQRRDLAIRRIDDQGGPPVRQQVARLEEVGLAARFQISGPECPRVLPSETPGLRPR